MLILFPVEMPIYFLENLVHCLNFSSLQNTKGRRLEIIRIVIGRLHNNIIDILAETILRVSELL